MIAGFLINYEKSFPIAKKAAKILFFGEKQNFKPLIEDHLDLKLIMLR